MAPSMWAFLCLLAAGASTAVGARLRGRQRSVAAAMAVLALGGCLVLAPAGLALDKVLARLALPAGLAWLAAGGGAGWAFARGRHRSALLWAAMAALIWLAGAPVVGERLMEGLEAPYRSLDPLKQPPVDAVVVLGGGTQAVEGRPRLYLAGDRVLLGAQLYRMGRTKRLVTTGSSIPALGPIRDLTEETSEIWRSLGVPEAAIVRLPEPKNTRQELDAVKAWVDTSTVVESIGLVTSAWHLDRALAQAERVGLKVRPLPADVRSAPDQGFNLQDFIPAGPGFDEVHRALWEHLGRAVGR